MNATLLRWCVGVYSCVSEFIFGQHRRNVFAQLVNHAYTQHSEIEKKEGERKLIDLQSIWIFCGTISLNKTKIVWFLYINLFKLREINKKVSTMWAKWFCVLCVQRERSCKACIGKWQLKNVMKFSDKSNKWIANRSKLDGI